jgi:hypothetical protein
MPTAFGPAPGPRNLPHAKRDRRYRRDAVQLSVTARTEGGPLLELLPAHFALDPPARLEVAVARYTNVGWLAGRAYNLVALRIPVIFQGEDGPVAGGYVPLMWENKADCLLTGRDELGVAKIFADITDIHEDVGCCRCRASWEGFQFFEMEVVGLAAAEPPAISGPLFFHKYIPRTGFLGEADVDLITATGPDGGSTQIHAVKAGTGSFRFQPARWEDMPTQYHIVNALAEVPILSFETAWLVESSGGGDLMGQRVVR